MNEKIESKRKFTEIQPIYSMWLREVIRFFNMKPRVISTIVQPVLFLALLALPMSKLFHGTPPEMEQTMFGGLNFFSFLVPGIVGIGLLFGGTMSGVTVLWDKDFGFLKEVMVAPVRRTSLMLGRTFGGLTVGMLQALITIGVASVFGIWYGFKISSLSGFLLAIVFCVLTFFIFSCFGIILGGLFEGTEGFMAFVNLIQMPLFFLSGAMIPISQLKGVPVLYQIQFINPLTYGVDGLRSALTGSTPFFPIWIDIIVLIAVAVVFLLLGAYTFSKMEVD
ncbi:ABC transporter permease [Candidatus Methanoliparum sp. LAM-1]|uniref:ABC transporter permease n=1 Tax=Candidatus Methanoliparum sp. LAM-1 TaxID=2874846 RepID=UPI001E4F070C|nr:ABC transporter permease [Candidatus Methanoliparum sp. LAM-1]BDC36274.1 multidrug ABC transporter permease [Candidatus Methanoliparum sp. LAM-1]